MTASCAIVWSTNRTRFTEQLHHGSDVECVNTNMLQAWAKLLSDHLTLETDTVVVVPETEPVQQQQPPAPAVGRSAKRLVTMGNPGGDTPEAAQKRIDIVTHNVESGMTNRVFNRRTKKSSDMKISHVVRQWRELSQQQPLRMEPSEWTSKSSESSHNQFDWASEFPPNSSFDSSEILGKLGLHHCLHVIQ